MRRITNSLFVLLLVLSCNTKKKKTVIQEQLKEDTTVVVAPPVENKDSVLLKLTDEILIAFKNRDYKALASFVHPTEGVRFSPYAYIDSTTDKIVTANWISEQAAPNKQEKIKWGEYDPTGVPIKKTLNDYIKEFVYDVDFLKPENRKVNGFLGGGNTQNNLLAMYADCDFTESHFSGFDPKYDGMDWRSLRLVFKKNDDRYYLVGVVHDEWTT